MDIKKFIEGLGENKEELLKKSAQCNSAQELLELAKENGIDIDETEAAEIIASMEIKPGKLSDDELDAVAGGFGDKNDPKPAPPIAPLYCKKCGHMVNPVTINCYLFCPVGHNLTMQ